MDVRKFNEKVINARPHKDLSIIQNFLVENPESDQIYNLCRSLYCLVYNGFAQNSEGKLGIFLSDESISDFGNKVVITVKFIDDKNFEKVFRQLIDVIRAYYTSTATRDEIETRSYFEPDNSNSMVVGKYFDFNHLPDWEGFEEKLRSLI